jgi:hypothetical protein
MIESRRLLHSDHDRRKKACLFTHLGCRKKHLLDRPLRFFFYQLSHQLNQLALLFSSGITVADLASYTESTYEGLMAVGAAKQTHYHSKEGCNNEYEKDVSHSTARSV